MAWSVGILPEGHEDRLGVEAATFLEPLGHLVLLLLDPLGHQPKLLQLLDLAAEPWKHIRD